MTVTYSLDCSTSTSTTFLRLLIRWRGSVYKLLYKELVVYLVLYFLLSFIYRNVLDQEQRRQFELFSLFCEKHLAYIPLNFVLGFYVSTIVTRWWSVFKAIAWVDRTALHVCCYLKGNDERARMMRRTVMRYMNLAHVFVLRDISSAVKKRFPTFEQLVNAGFISQEELEMYSSIECNSHTYWVLIQWCSTLLSRARKEDRIGSDYLLNRVVDELLSYRDSLQMLLNYDWISVPLVYTQVVTVAVYGFFLASLSSRQYLDPQKNYRGNSLDLYVPIFTLLQFLFYMGLLKVAEALINPLGEDDDDFEVNYILERNLQVGYLIVDDSFNKVPKLERDIYWNDSQPEIPHTTASLGVKDTPQIGSAANIQVSEEQSQIVYSEGDFPPTPNVARRLSKVVADGISYLRSLSMTNDRNTSSTSSRRSSLSSVADIKVEDGNRRIMLSPITELSIENLSQATNHTHL